MNEYRPLPLIIYSLYENMMETNFIALLVNFHHQYLVFIVLHIYNIFSN